MIDGVSSLYTSGWKYMQYQSQQTESSTASETSPQPPPGRRPDSSAESTEQENMNWATPPPPPPMQVDTDGDGSWSEDELSALASDIQEKTGQTIDTEAILSQYDADSDGALSESEQKDFLDSVMKQPPPGSLQDSPAVQETEESDDNSLKIKMIDLLLSKYKSSAGSEDQTTSQAIDALS